KDNSTPVRARRDFLADSAQRRRRAPQKLAYRLFRTEVLRVLDWRYQLVRVSSCGLLLDQGGTILGSFLHGNGRRRELRGRWRGRRLTRRVAGAGFCRGGFHSVSRRVGTFRRGRLGAIAGAGRAARVYVHHRPLDRDTSRTDIDETA